MKRLLSAFLLSCVAPAAVAAPIGFTFNAGPVVFVELGPVDPEVAAFQGFQLGESVLVTFAIDDATPDIDPIDQRGEFEDPTGTITLTGAISGTTIAMRPGVNIQLDSVFEFDLRNILVGPVLHVFELFDDTDFLSVHPILSDPDDLAVSIAELASLLDPQGHFLGLNLALGSTAAVGTLDSLGAFVALEFGPVAWVPSAPAPLLLLLGLAALPFFGSRAASLFPSSAG
ncbi:MAG: hypothetical protein KDG50_08600 [Chromatiales bacterium]|nr:hypothetical protein [Chromatiales bacterium]